MVDIKDFRRILQPLQQGSLRNKIAFLKEVSHVISCNVLAILSDLLPVAEKQLCIFGMSTVRLGDDHSACMSV